MPGQRNQRRYQRFDPSTAWMARGSDPAAGTSPDPPSPAPSQAGHRSAADHTARSNRRARRAAAAPPPASVRPQARTRHSRTVRRRRRGPVRALLLLPFRRVLVGYVRALLRALLPWLLPLAALAALPYILSMLAGH
jgi:hypothetical protein